MSVGAGLGAQGLFAVGAPPSPRPPASVYDPFTDERRVRVWMLELATEQAVAVTVPFAAGFGMPHGISPLGGRWFLPVQRITAAPRRWATHGFVPAEGGEHVEGRLAPVTLRKELQTDAEGFWRALARSAVGDIELENTDGALDDLTDAFLIEGRNVRLSQAAVAVDSLTGRLVPPTLAEFRTAFSGEVDGWFVDTKKARLRVRDLTRRLETPILLDRYPEVPAEGADAASAGLTKPLALGIVRGMTPVLADAARLIYDVSSGSVRAVDVVRDAGVRLTQRGDVATLKALQDLRSEGPLVPAAIADIRFGEYATCLEAGKIRLGRRPVGVLTADLRGQGGYELVDEPFDDGTFFDDGTGFVSRISDRVYEENVVALALGVLTDLTEIPNAVIKDVFSAHVWESLNRLRPRAGGLYLTPTAEAPAALEILEFLLGAVGMALTVDREGRLFPRLLGPPTRGHTLVLDEKNTRVDSLERLEVAYRRPTTGWRALYAPVFRPLAENEIAGLATAADRAFISQAVRAVEAQAFLYRQLYPAEKTRTVQTPLNFRLDALALAEQRLALYTVGRRCFRVSAVGLAYALEILDTVRLVSPRFGLSQGRNMLVTSTEEGRTGRETVLTLWG